MTSTPVDPAPGSATDDDHVDGQRVRHTRRRGRLVFIITLVLLLGLLAAAVGTAWLFTNRLSANIPRIPDAFAIPEEHRPAEAATDSVTFLLGGLDEGGTVGAFEPGTARTDTIMLVHIPEGHDRAYAVSIPRDTWVSIPEHGENKINAAYSLGGPALFVRTIEDLTDIRVDHLAMLDWSGFEELIDAVDGVAVTVDEPAPLAGGGSVLEPGTHTLDGATALQYVRERYDLPGGDFDRVKRQQNVMRSLGSQILTSGTLADPGRIWELSGAVGNAVGLDDDLGAVDLVRLGLSMRDLRVSGMTFLTVPTLGTDRAGSQSIVVYDSDRAEQLWLALADDTIDDFLADNPDVVTPESVR